MESDGLGPLERRVMTSLWAHGPQTPREALERLNTAGVRTLAYTTVMTILVRLVEKRYLRREREGRAFRYTAVVREMDVADVAGRRELDLLLGRYGAANVARFAVELGPTGAELIDRLRALAEDDGEAPG